MSGDEATLHHIRKEGSYELRWYTFKGRNPKTGKIVDVPSKKLPHFKVGKELKDLVNKQGVERDIKNTLQDDRRSQT